MMYGYTRDQTLRAPSYTAPEGVDNEGTIVRLGLRPPTSVCTLNVQKDHRQKAETKLAFCKYQTSTSSGSG